MCALRFIDSFDDRSSVNSMKKGWIDGLTSTPDLSTLYGRTDQGMWLTSDGNMRPVIPLDTSQDTWILGFAFKVPAVSLSDHYLIFFWDLNGNTYHWYAFLRSTGKIEIRRGDSVLLLETTAVFTANVWQHIEFKVKISNAAGSVDVRRNGASCGSVSGIDTQNSANAFCTHLQFQGGGAVGVYIDDLYLCDGSAADDFRGDCKVYCLLPDGAGALTTWTPSAGANFQNVDDPNTAAPAPDGDSTYNSSSTPGNRDSFTFEDLASGGIVEGVQLSTSIRKTDAGGRSFKPFTRQAAVNYDGTVVGVGDNYYSYPQMWELNPATAAAWTTSEINTDAEFGIKDEA